MRQAARKMEELVAAKENAEERDASTNMKLLAALDKIKLQEKTIEELRNTSSSTSSSSSSSSTDPRVSELLLKLQGQETIADSLKGFFLFFFVKLQGQ
jgi:hypothetical protein